MLELRAVTKRLGGVAVLDGVDLSIRPRSTTALIGPSGCGKSTLLRLFLGLIRPDAGSVLLDGATVEPSNVIALRRRVGYVIQEGGLFPHMTARENVSLMARQLGWGRSRIEQRLHDLLVLTDFPRGAFDRYPVELSGGQRQRVALMRALMLEPDLLLLDEPLGALDPMIRFDLQNDLREIFRELGKTVVLVTHDLAEASHFAHEIVLLREGRVAQRGSLHEMVRDPADEFVSRFVAAQRGLALGPERE